MTLKVAALVAAVVLSNGWVVPRLEYFLSFELYFALLVFLGVWVVSLAALAYVAFVPIVVVRIAWAVPIALSTFVGTLYLGISGVLLTYDALEAGWQQPAWMPKGDLERMLQQFARPTAGAVIPVALLLIGLLAPPYLSRLRRRRLALLPFAPIVLVLVIRLLFIEGVGRETWGMPAQFRPLAVVALFSITPNLKSAKAEVEMIPESEALAAKIVVVVDESVRSDFVGIEPGRGVTPSLEAVGPFAADFGPAFSASNCSNATNGILRLGADPRRLGREAVDILNNPSIWKYARASGFETSFIEVQSLESSFTAYYMNGEEVALIDDYVSVPLETAEYMWDQEIAKAIGGQLARPGRQLVYVNKFGAHFPYGNRYPPDRALPVRPRPHPGENTPRARLVEEYSRAIDWTVDAFFETLLDLVDLEQAVVIYTADHGQNLLDDGQLITHCRHPDPIVEEAVVPLIVLTRKAELLADFRQAAASGVAPASHFQVFPTVLELFGYPRDQVRERYYRSLLEPTSESLGFLSGSIRPRFGRLPTWNAAGSSLSRFE